MYTDCLIQFIDDGTEMFVIIKANDEVQDDIDDLVFFYGLSRDRLIQACQDGDVLENEWKVLSVGITYDEL